MSVIIREATEADARAIWEIYAFYIRETPVTFETDVFPVAEMQARIGKDPQNIPWFVAEEEGRIIGYAYGGPHRNRAAYITNREVSCYLAHAAQGKGIGRQLYVALFARLKQAGFKNLLAGITVPNKRSEHFHEKLGFKRVALYHRIGKKLGKWHDVAWYELWIGDDDETSL